MRFRCLTDEELTMLEGELKQFLIANGVYAEDWRKLNAESPDKALKLVELFSDKVLEKVLEQTQYMIHRSAGDLKAFHCAEEGMVLMGLKLSDSGIDLTQSPYKEDLNLVLQEAGSQAKLFRASKGYTANREDELFQMMEQGCEIANEHIFKRLEALYQA